MNEPKKKDGINRYKAGDANRCAPKSGEVICAKARRLDRTTAHEHFRPDEMRKATAWVKRIRGTAGAPSRPSDETWKQYVERWFAARSYKSPDSVWGPLKRTFPYIGDVRLVDIDSLVLQGLQTKMYKGSNPPGPFAYTTTKVAMKWVKVVIKSALAAGVLQRDPRLGLTPLPRDSQAPEGTVTREEVPTREEVRAIIDATPAHYLIGVLLLFGCGMRLGEVLGLAVEDVDLAKGTLSLTLQRQRRGLVDVKSWRGVRVIEPPEQVLVELRRLLRSDLTAARAVRRRSRPVDIAKKVMVVHGPRSDRMLSEVFYRQVWGPSLERAGLAERGYTPHHARHFAASSMLDAGIGAPEVAAYIGDSVATLSNTYSHWLRGGESRVKGVMTTALSPTDEADTRRRSAGE